MRPPPAARPLTWLLLAVALSACGSRSTLLLGEGPPFGSAQGGSGQGGTAQGGSGGQGPCTSLTPHLPVLSAPTDSDVQFDDDLRLTASSEDGLRVTGVFVRGLKSSKVAVYHTTLSPWKTWPTDVDLAVRPTLIHPLDSPAPSLSPGDHFAFATLTDAGVFLFPALDPEVSGQAPSPGDIPLPGNDATFVAPRAAWQSGPTHLAGTFDSVLGQTGTLLREDGTLYSTAPLGCSSVQPSSAAAVPFQDGWLAAVSSGSPLAPGCAPETPDLPTRVDLLRVSPEGSLTLLASLPSGVVISVGLTPHPEGAYVVWLESNMGIGVLRGARVDGTTGTLVGPVDLTPQGEQPQGFAAASVGTSLGLVRESSGVGGLPHLSITVRDESLAETAYTQASSGDDTPSLSSALGSPDGKGLLVAWTSYYPAPSRVHLARFDCSE